MNNELTAESILMHHFLNNHAHGAPMKDRATLTPKQAKARKKARAKRKAKKGKK